MISRHFFQLGNPYRMIIPEGSPPSMPPKLVAILNTFEDNLSHRIKNLRPMHTEDILSLSWMKKAMESLSKTYSDVNHLIAELKIHVCDFDWDSKWINAYLDNSVKFHNMCIAIRKELAKLIYSRLLLMTALIDLNSTPSKKLVQACSSLQRWMTFINRKTAMFEDCFCNLDNLIIETLDLSKIGNFVNEEKITMLAMFGAKVQTVFVCTIIAAALSRSSCAEKIIDLEVPETCLWATALYDVQSFVNVKIRDLHVNGKIIEVKEVEVVNQYAEKLCRMIQDGVEPVDAAEAFENNCSELRKSAENITLGVVHLEKEVEGFIKILQSERNDLLSFREKYRGRVADQAPKSSEKYSDLVVEQPPESSGQSLPLCIEASRPKKPNRPFFPFGNPFKAMLPKGSSRGLSRKLVSVLNTFEDNLSHRIKKLKPLHLEDVFSLSWMKEAMESLSKTHSDVNRLILTLKIPVCDCDWDGKWIDAYLDNSVKFHNICTAIIKGLAWLIYGTLKPRTALSDLNSTPSKQLQACYMLRHWMKHINCKTSMSEDCFGDLDNLIIETNDLSKIGNFANEEKIIMLAMFGEKVQILFVCSIIAAALSRSSCAKKFVDLEVPETCLWAAAFYDVQSFVNVEIRNLYASGKRIEVKEVEGVNRDVEKLYSMIHDGLDGAETLENNCSKLENSTEKLTIELSHLLKEVEGLKKILQSGRNELLSLREKYRGIVAEQARDTLPSKNIMMMNWVRDTKQHWNDSVHRLKYWILCAKRMVMGEFIKSYITVTEHDHLHLE